MIYANNYPYLPILLPSPAFLGSGWYILPPQRKSPRKSKILHFSTSRGQRGGAGGWGGVYKPQQDKHPPSRIRIRIRTHARAHAPICPFPPPIYRGGEMWVRNRAGAYAYEKAGSGIGLFLAANKRYLGERESSPPLGRRAVVAVDIPCSR